MSGREQRRDDRKEVSERATLGRERIGENDSTNLVTVPIKLLELGPISRSREGVLRGRRSHSLRDRELSVVESSVSGSILIVRICSSENNDKTRVSFPSRLTHGQQTKDWF